MEVNSNETKNANTSGPTEIQNWDETPLIRDNILRGIYANGFEQPSPIQKKGIVPMIRTDKNGKRRDIIAQAQSGTGTRSYSSANSRAS
jgi:translation initiation factor 4A